MSSVRTKKQPNLLDYEAILVCFSWENIGKELNGLPEGRGLNIVHEARDRHVKAYLKDTVALPFIQKNRSVTAICQLLKRIAPDTEPSALQPDENIRKKLNIDSFDSLQFIVSLNEKFGIEIPEKDYGKISTLKSLTGYLLKKLKSQLS